MKSKLTIIESEKYDRQIRLWGLKSQKKLRTGKILFWCLDGGNIEILKNCVLAGVGSVCLVDDRKISQNDIESHFYLKKEDIGKKITDISVSFFRKMNPDCIITVKSEKNIRFNLDILTNFSLVVLANQSMLIQKKFSSFCRSKNIPYFYNRSVGMYGYAFCDCISFKSSRIRQISKHKNVEKDKDKLTNTMIRPSKVSKICLPPVFMNPTSKDIVMMNWPSFEEMLKQKFKLDRSYQKLMGKILITCQALESLSTYDQAIFKKEIQNLFKKRRMSVPKCFFEDNIISSIIHNWGLNTCITNTMIGGFLSNSILTCLQCSYNRPPFQNILTFDLFNQDGIQTNLGGTTTFRNVENFFKR